MDKKWIIIGSIVGLILIIFMMYRGSYNSAITLQENVDEKWGNVGASYQRRADLIPQLVETVKGAATNEKDILTSVTNARAGISEGIKNAKTPEEMDKVGKTINNAINLAFENYPQIRSTENFQGLQTQLEGTENRIATSRKEFNEAVKEYNSHIRGFLNSMFLNANTFPKKEAFKADEGSENAPKVDFSK